MGSLGRFLLEYVGNVDLPHDEDPKPRLDWIKVQMEERGVPVAQEQEFLHDLRQAIQEVPEKNG